MSAECKVILAANVTGLGKTLEFTEAFVTTSTPTKKSFGYQTQAVADTAEALNVGNITTAQLVVVKAITNIVNIDTSYSAAFHAEISLQVGEVAVFKPTGVVYIQNATAAQQVTVECLVVG